MLISCQLGTVGTFSASRSYSMYRVFLRLNIFAAERIGQARVCGLSKTRQGSHHRALIPPSIYAVKVTHPPASLAQLLDVRRYILFISYLACRPNYPTISSFARIFPAHPASSSPSHSGHAACCPQTPQRRCIGTGQLLSVGC